MHTYLNELRAAVERLAAPARQQIDYIKKIGVYPSADELALEFHELALLADEEAKRRTLSLVQRDAINILDHHLDAMSGEGNAQLWTAKALQTAPEWNRIRGVARESMNVLSASEGS